MTKHRTIRGFLMWTLEGQLVFVENEDGTCRINTRNETVPIIYKEQFRNITLLGDDN
jgi:hypothetical protein